MGCYDGHTGWANSVAMRIAGIDRETPDPPNGVIVRDADGEATGALKEEAQLLVERHIPVPSEEEDRASVRQAIAGLHALGLTAAQDAWLTPEELAFWQRVHADGELAAPVPRRADHGARADARRVARPPRRVRGAGVPAPRRRRTSTRASSRASSTA